MKKKNIILSCLSIVCAILVFIALALPVYVAPVSEWENLNLADTMFGYSEEGMKILKLNPLLLAAFLANILGLVCVLFQFIPQMKGKQALRAVAGIAFFIGGAVFMASNGSYQGESGISSVLKLYKDGYAEKLAGVACFVAGFAILFVLSDVYVANKRSKQEKQN